MSPERTILYCQTCNTKYNVAGVAAEQRFLCKSCRCVIRIPAAIAQEPFFKLSESRELLKPELLLTEDPNVIHDDLEHAFEFTKMAATENDYILVDCFREEVQDPSSLAKVICHRRRGIGADGVLLFRPSEDANFQMAMFNPDGSEAEMCGNGIRCLARYAFDHEYTTDTEFTVETKAGLRHLTLALENGVVRSVRVDMGVAEVRNGPGFLLPLVAKGRTFEGVEVSVGNPHFVVFIDEDVDDVPLLDFGPALERHPHFPDRSNVEFVKILSPHEVVQRTYERGVGETLGCGTGATAVAAAGLALGLTKETVTLHLKGGDLEVEITPQGQAFLTGPAIEVFSGSWTPGGIKSSLS
jgi:diaminopimelate epimerase